MNQRLNELLIRRGRLLERIATVAVAVLVVLKPGRIVRWAKRAFFTWQTWRTLRDKLPIFGLKAGL